MSRWRRVTVVAIAAVCGACCLGCAIAALLIVFWNREVDKEAALARGRDAPV